MKKTLGIIMLTGLCLINLQTAAQQPQQRESLTLPAAAKAIILGEMRGHIVALDAVITALGHGDYKGASKVASSELGVLRFQNDAHAKGQGSGLDVGQHLPVGFRMIGQDFRKAGNRFAQMAEKMPKNPSSDQHQALYGALSEITHQCSICHDSYKID